MEKYAPFDKFGQAERRRPGRGGYSETLNIGADAAKNNLKQKVLLMVC